MRTRQTPQLSKEGVAEIVAEMNAAPADTPERRAMFERASATRFLVDQVLQDTVPGARKG